MPIQKFTVLTLPNLFRILKGLAYLAAGLCGLSIVFLVLLLLINLPVFDEDLHPDLVVPPLNDPVEPLPNNAYAGLMGLRASPGQDFVAAGQALMERYLVNRTFGNDRLTDEDYDELLGPDPLVTGLLPEESCRTPAGVCSLEQVSAMLRDGDYDRARMDLILQRYAALLALPAMQPMINPTLMTPAPGYQTARDAQKYSLAASYNSGSPTIFLNQVAADLKFWKMVVRGGPWMLDKMVAIASLWTDMQMLSEYMATHELSAEDRALIASFLVPLSSEELDISDAFMAEAQSIRNTLEYLRAHPDDPWAVIDNRLQLQLTLTNATANQNYTEVLQPVIAVSKLSRRDYERAINTPEYQASPQGRAQPGVYISTAYRLGSRQLGLSPRNLYNLGGKLLLGEPTWYGAYTYVGRMHDINTMMLAVKLQFELKGTAPELLPEALRNASSTPPYSDVTFNYDTEDGWLAFDCFDPPSRNALRCRVQL
jgi:hypothetical protein